nr:hypothetical protein [Tanacetum cinerariifolium]
MHMVDLSIASLLKSINPNPVYQTPLDDLILIRDAIFYVIPSPKRLTKECEIIVRDPFQMELSEIKLDFKKWETILSKNVISLTGNKDHMNAFLVYMLYCLATQKLLNLAYSMVREWYVTTIQPCPLTDGHLLDEKKPHPLTSSSSLSPQSQTHDQEQVDSVENFELEPIRYCNKFSPLPGASEEFKQTKGMFKCLGYFLSNLGKKKKK